MHNTEASKGDRYASTFEQWRAHQADNGQRLSSKSNIPLKVHAAESLTHSRTATGDDRLSPLARQLAVPNKSQTDFNSYDEHQAASNYNNIHFGKQKLIDADKQMSFFKSDAQNNARLTSQTEPIQLNQDPLYRNRTFNHADVAREEPARVD